MNFVLGDRILEINGHSLEGLSRQEVKYFENPQVDVEAYNSLFKYTSQGVDTGFFNGGAPLRKSKTDLWRKQILKAISTKAFYLAIT